VCYRDFRVLIQYFFICVDIVTVFKQELERTSGSEWNVYISFLLVFNICLYFFSSCVLLFLLVFKLDISLVHCAHSWDIKLEHLNYISLCAYVLFSIYFLYYFLYIFFKWYVLLFLGYFMCHMTRKIYRYLVTLLRKKIILNAVSLRLLARYARERMQGKGCKGNK
jgi:hypothetical protein